MLLSETFFEIFLLTGLKNMCPMNGFILTLLPLNFSIVFSIKLKFILIFTYF